MNIEEFVKNVLISLDNAIGGANKEAKNHKFNFYGTQDRRVVEFDVAVLLSPDSHDKKDIRVASHVGNAGGYTRIQFGVNFNENIKS